MKPINEFSKEELVALQESVFSSLQSCRSIKAAAQLYTRLMYEHLKGSVILCRLFLTRQYGELPEPNKQFVRNLVGSAGPEQQLKNETLILSLLGSHGENPEWNDCSHSKGHLGIPLISPDFIEKIPMMSRLLKALGLGLGWIDGNDTAIIGRTTGNLSGIFHVKDAGTEVDAKGRLVISAQDFVRRYGVKSVFGLGGEYIGNTVFFVVIVFLRETIAREIAQRFILHANKFKAATIGHLEDGMIE